MDSCQKRKHKNQKTKGTAWTRVKARDQGTPGITVPDMT